MMPLGWDSVSFLLGQHLICRRSVILKNLTCFLAPTLLAASIMNYSVTILLPSPLPTTS